jgi:hypothetical protein
MSTKDAEYRTLAAEAFAALVPTDRVPVALLAGAMHQTPDHRSNRRLC